MQAKNKEKLYYHLHTKVLPPLQRGSRVVIRTHVTLTGPFSGLFLKSDPTVPFLYKLTEDL